MAIVSPALRGQMGTTEYYLSKMVVRELLQGVSPAQDYHEWWRDLPPHERMQRDANLKRVKDQIAPYLAKSKDRFFGSIIVLVYEGELIFESLIKDFKFNLPRAYKSQAEDIGFITIDGGKLLVLDGQHRWYGLKSVMQGEVEGSESSQVATDEVSVIFIKHESDEKTRRIFNKVNRYAKSTSRGDNILTSEDDGIAIVTRRLVYQPIGPFYSGVKMNEEGLVTWKHNTLAPRSKSITTLSALYEITEIILKLNSCFENFTEKETINRPSDEELDEATGIVVDFWNELFEQFIPFKQVVDGAKPANIPNMRLEGSPYSLLFKPAGQIAFVDGLVDAILRSGLHLSTVIERANKRTWSMNDSHWTNVIINLNKSIIASPDARERAKQLTAYLLVGDKMKKSEIKEIKYNYNIVNGIDIDNLQTDQKVLELPELAL
ncbi:DGQHR domain-containing protein [Rubrolithibacter danxiaensis]|uniref:DGQHR domain-containing protein n=1 Tax=Rubrolithibacter danxiaensis TaxID=3390805 RepID=UPI003BF8F988